MAKIGTQITYKIKTMGKLLLARHGLSMWNLNNIFTGWTDVDLAPQGIEEAKLMGQLLKEKRIDIDICFSSYLKRAIHSQWIILENADQMYVDCIYNWKLNERHYGSWQGKNKDEILKLVGEKKYLAIRRGMHQAPPPLSLDNKQHPQYDSNYKNIETSLLPSTESLKDTQNRVVNYFYKAIIPELAQDKTVLVTAHGNSIRALMAKLENRSDAETPYIEVPTGTLFLYEFDTQLNLIEFHRLIP